MSSQVKDRPAIDPRPSLVDVYAGHVPQTGLICIDTPIGQICWIDRDAPQTAEWFDDAGQAWPEFDLRSLLQEPA